MRKNEKMFENLKPHLPLALFIVHFYKKKQEQCNFFYLQNPKPFSLTFKKVLKRGKIPQFDRLTATNWASAPNLTLIIRFGPNLRLEASSPGVVPAVLSRAELPKSAILTCPVMSSNMFSGLISR